MMNEELFSAHGTSYRDIHQLVCFLVKQVCRQYGIWDQEEDMISQGMLAAIEVLQKYEQDRETKATSYIFMFVKGRLREYADEYCRYRRRSCELDESDAKTDNTGELAGFTADPYRMQPDVLYDVKRREHLVEKLGQIHNGEVRQFVEASNSGGSPAERQRAMRRRLKSIREIRGTIDRILEHNATLSRITEVINLLKLHKDQ